MLDTDDYKIVWSDEIEDDKIKWNKYDTIFDIYFLDHDLGGDQMVSIQESNTGSEFAKWLVKQGVKGNNETIYVHSLNPAGAINMMAKFDKSIRAPFTWLVDGVDKL